METRACAATSGLKENDLVSYALDKNRREALRRLRLLARSEDPGTIACLERIGVAPGWRCLEVGAGAGTIAQWLAERVGIDGRVVATDIDISVIESLRSPTLEMLRHDVTADELENGAYDLVHARQVLMHLPEREAVLEKLAAAVKPGGWLFVEDADASTDGPDPTVPESMQSLYRKVIAEIYAFVVSKGIEPTFGTRLFGLFGRLGFEEVRAEGRLPIHRGHPKEDASSHVPVFVELRGLILERGAVTNKEFDEFLALTRNPAFSWREGLTIATWGRKPR